MDDTISLFNLSSESYLGEAFFHFYDFSWAYNLSLFHFLLKSYYFTASEPSIFPKVNFKSSKAINLVHLKHITLKFNVDCLLVQLNLLSEEIFSLLVHVIMFIIFYSHHFLSKAKILFFYYCGYYFIIYIFIYHYFAWFSLHSQQITTISLYHHVALLFPSHIN